MLFSSEVRPDGRPGRTPGGAIGFCRESYGPPTSLAPDPVPGARRAPRPGVPARSAAVRAVGSALDGEGAPKPVGAHRGVGPGPAPGPPALHLEPLGGRRRNDRRRPVRLSLI